MSGRVLVTGGAGFIGSHIAEAYLKAGWEVVILDDLSRGHERNLPNTGIGKRTKNVVEKRPAIERDHGLEAGVGNTLLLGREARGRIGRTHPRSKPARQNDGACRGHALRNCNRRILR